MQEIILPKLGQTMEEGTIVEWLKKEGDPVNKGDILFQVETDKAVLEVESKAKGTLLKILVDKGIKVPVLTVVGLIGEPGEDISAYTGGAKAGQAKQPGSASPTATSSPQAMAQPSPGVSIEEEGRIAISPRARALAREKGVDYRHIVGSGPGGRIIERDVLAYLEKQPPATPLARHVAQELGVALEEVAPAGVRLRAEEVRAAVEVPHPPQPEPFAAPAAPPPPAEGEVTPLTGLRAIIAERMARSSQTTAAVTLQSVVDATELVALRERLKAALEKELGFAIGYNDLLAVIVTRCLVEFPYMNVRLEEGGIRHIPDVNLGLAVDSERGLLVPVVHGAQNLRLKEFAIRFRDLVARARAGKALPDDLTGGTFTITNLGMFGVDMFTPIINLPECAILGVGRIHPEPAVVEGQIVIRQRMWLSLTFDHRLVDGAPAARFLQGIMRYIEAPYLLLA